MNWIEQRGISVVGRVMGLDGSEVEVDGVGYGIGGSVGGVEATRCLTASRNMVTMSSIGSERNRSISTSVRGWLVLTF